MKTGVVVGVEVDVGQPPLHLQWSQDMEEIQPSRTENSPVPLILRLGREYNLLPGPHAKTSRKLRKAVCQALAVMHAAVLYKNRRRRGKKPAAAAFGGVDSYHTETQARAIVIKLTMNSTS